MKLKLVAATFLGVVSLAQAGTIISAELFPLTVKSVGTYGSFLEVRPHGLNTFYRVGVPAVIQINNGCTHIAGHETVVSYRGEKKITVKGTGPAVTSPCTTIVKFENRLLPVDFSVAPNAGPTVSQSVVIGDKSYVVTLDLRAPQAAATVTAAP